MYSSTSFLPFFMWFGRITLHLRQLLSKFPTPKRSPMIFFELQHHSRSSGTWFIVCNSLLLIAHAYWSGATAMAHLHVFLEYGHGDIVRKTDLNDTWKNAWVKIIYYSRSENLIKMERSGLTQLGSVERTETGNRNSIKTATQNSA